MANIQYFYIDANGQKCGPVDEGQFKELASSGVITPVTPTTNGYYGRRTREFSEMIFTTDTQQVSGKTSPVFFDIGFTRFITNTWISILWVLSIILAFLGCVIAIGYALFNEAHVLIVIAPIVAALFLLFMRIAFELDIIVFRMETRLRTIEKNSETMSLIESHLRFICDKYENK